MKNLKKVFIIVLCFMLVAICTLTAAAASTPSISISNKTAAAEETVVIDISITNNPGIMAMTFCITYDSSAFTYEGYEKGYLTSYTLKDHSDKGHVSFVNIESSDKSTNGKIISLSFKVKPDAKPGKYPIALANSNRQTHGNKLHNSFSNSNLDYIVPTVSTGSITIPETCENSGHKFSAWEIISPADCTNTGLQKHNCIRCDFSEEETIPITHDFEDEWTIDKAATPEEDGIMSRHCKACEAVTDKITFSYEEIGDDDTHDTSSEETSSDISSDDSEISGGTSSSDNSSHESDKPNSSNQNSTPNSSNENSTNNKPNIENIVGEKVPQQEAEKLENYPKPETEKPDSSDTNSTTDENITSQENTSENVLNNSITTSDGFESDESSFFETTTGIIMIVVCSALSIGILVLGIILIIKNKKQ